MHRHDEYSTYDGFGKAQELVVIAKRLGHTALGTSNHGNTNGLVKHYFECKKEGIKPVLGCEIYYKPKVDNTKPYYHLCLFVKDIIGYHNLNEILSIAEGQKYYKPIVTTKELSKYSEGIICTTACIAGYAAQAILKSKEGKAEQYLNILKGIYEDDLYVEIQPYTISEEGVQEKVNYELIKLAKELNIKTILTSDSHYGDKADFDTYLKMHEMAGHNLDMIQGTYKERYMPSDKELLERFVTMHSTDYGTGNARKMAKYMIINLKEIEDKVDGDVLDKLEMSLPNFSEGKEKTSYEILEDNIWAGLKKRGKYTKKYVARCKEELEAVKHLHFENYFLIVQDYTLYAKNHGIPVGPGRGSGCNALINYALGITDVDSILFGLDFRRFLRKDKVKMPDIDLDFATNRRKEVIEYMIKKYKGQSCQICSYGLYKVDNLLNDLGKVCGLPTTGKELDPVTKQANKDIIAKLKKLAAKYVSETELDKEGLRTDKQFKTYNGQYDNILKHFSLLFRKVKYIGTHAAGVALVAGNIFDYTAIRMDKNGAKYANYDLTDLEMVHVIKFDILGLNTMEELGELRHITGNEGIGENEQWTTDKKIIRAFGEGNTGGIFQFEKETARNILINIKCDCFEDVIAASSMNRPGPLSLGMPELYASNKQDSSNAQASQYWDYTKETYGTIIYQEQIQQICINLGKMEWVQADKIVKMQKGGSKREHDKFIKDYDEFKVVFLKGTKENKMRSTEAEELFDNLFNYSFNKGHSTGYALISVEEMFYKLHYPLEFWMCKLQTETKDNEIAMYKSEAVKAGCVVFLPHVNGSIGYEVKDYKGDDIIQEGLGSIKGIGVKAAKTIIESGPYIDYPDFEEKWQALPKEQRRQITKKTIAILKDKGCFEFNEGRYLQNTLSYNSTLCGKSYHM